MSAVDDDIAQLQTLVTKLAADRAAETTIQSTDVLLHTGDTWAGLIWQEYVK